MALILFLLRERKAESVRPKGEENPALECRNPHCICTTERGIKKLFKGEVCIYCDQTAFKL